MKPILIVVAALAAIMTSGPRSSADEVPKLPTPELVWAAATLGEIQGAFYLPESGLYAEEIGPGKKLHPAWLWDASAQLAALCAAAHLYPDTYLPQVKSYAAALRAYRTQNHGVTGLDVNPPPKPPDRYYDDNAWITLSLLEAYDLTHDEQNLQLAKDAFGFVMTGEDDALGGGLYWHEDRKENKHACTCGPAILDAIRFYQITHEEPYLKTAIRVYDWTRKHLQDEDGLIFDSIRVSDGRQQKAKFSYNSATIIRAGAMLFQITKEQRYLDEAQRVAKAAEKKWVRPEDGIIADDGKFAHKLIESFLEVHEVDHDAHWLEICRRCVTSLRQHRDSRGWYPRRWDATLQGLIDPVRLIDQASAARAYWLVAGTR